ncbi:MAG: ImmA/IrrE family metallo-endopeptidase [Firmicutes bacterium]|nr:ImmA/IrrE family metallo-endopeptidase [Bacillota bacterium]
MFSKNLRYHRLLNGLTMRELADRVGLTSMAISNYEKGTRNPDRETLSKLAEVFNIRIVDLLTPRNDKLLFVHGQFRKNTRLGRSKQDLIHESIEEYFSRFYNIIEILGEANLPAVPACNIGQLSEDVEENARELRLWLNLGPEGPVPNLVDAVENKGILIFSKEINDRDFSGINGSVNGRPYIAVNRNMNPERQRFTIAHELAHLYFSWSPENECEKVSNAIADAFLFPRNDALRELGIRRTGIYRDMELTAKEYGISMLCLAYRARELKIVSEEAYRRFMKRASQMGWQVNEPSRINPEETRLFRQLVFRAVSEGEVSVQKGAELLQVSYQEVHEACFGEGAYAIN